MALYLHEKVADALVELARLGPFYRRSYDKDTGAATIDDSINIDPASVFAAEVSKGFGPSSNKMTYTRDLKDWMFELRLKFDVPVSLEAWEMNISDKPPFVPRDDVNGFRQVTLNIMGGQMEHPPQQQPATGTRARYLFEAVLSTK